MNLYLKIILLIIAISLTACQPNNSHRKIGIIVPLEHRAMNDIVAGFTQTLEGSTKEVLFIKVKNAQNDANMQRAIIQQLRDQHYSMIVPIGMNATQMSLAMIHDRPIVSLASEITEADRKKLHPCNVSIVHDQISSKQSLAFIHTAYPTLTTLALIHSSADKVFPEVKETIAAGKQLGITVIPKMVSTLPELYTVAQSLPNHAQGILLLKDHLIVSGISTLAKIATDHHLPLITSDEGSVQEGAGFALGVPEKQIGVEGAKLALDILSGKSACALPIVDMKNLTVFVNADALKSENQNLDAIIAAAKQLHYHVELTNTQGK